MITPQDSATLRAIVERYKRDLEMAERVTYGVRALVSAKKLEPLIHSVRARTKDPEHLFGSLVRKLEKCRASQREFDITPDNLFEKVHDLAGVRLLHLHTQQFGQINNILKELFDLEGWEILEGPKARVWDSEYGSYFKSIDVETEDTGRMYTSVHYVVRPNAKRSAEIQVRTLAEELCWEVDHTINYPHKCGDVACEEQLKVLARITSGCTRLVDSIFRSKLEADDRKPKPILAQDGK